VTLFKEACPSFNRLFRGSDTFQRGVPLKKSPVLR
jgi:hypothetical protein